MTPRQRLEQLDAKYQQHQPANFRQIQTPRARFNELSEKYGQERTWPEAIQEEGANEMRAAIGRQVVPAMPGSLAEGSLAMINFAKTIEETLARGKGARELTAGMIGGAIAEPAAGIAGMAASTIGGAQMGADMVSAVRERLTPEIGPQGLQAARTVGEYIPDAVSGTVEMIPGVMDEYGDATLESTGSPLLAAAVRTAPVAALMAAGPKVFSPVVAATANAPSTLPRVLGGNKIRASKEAKDLVLAGSTDKATAALKLRDPADDWSFQETMPADFSGATWRNPRANVVKDPVAKEAINQQLPAGKVAMFKNASNATKAKLREMLKIRKRIAENETFGLTNRSSDVTGRAFMDRLRIVKNVRDQARKMLDKAAKKLADSPAHHADAVDEFVKDLADDLRITRDSKSGSWDFSASIIDGDPGAQAMLNRLLKKMENWPAKNAEEVHWLKKYIDKTQTYGESFQGGSKSRDLTKIIKRLRHNLDQSLDTRHPDYKAVNDRIHETMDVLGRFDKASGAIDLLAENSETAVGTLLRRLSSKAQSRQKLLNAVDDLTEVARKYQTGKVLVPKGMKTPNLKSIQDDIKLQVSFDEMLDDAFGTHLGNTFQGQISKGTASAMRSVGGDKSNLIGLAGDMIDSAGNIIKNRNAEATFKALEALLRDAP